MSVCLTVKKKRLNSNYSDAQDKLKKDFGDLPMDVEIRIQVELSCEQKL